MTISFQDIAAQAARDGIITDAELLDLRRNGWCDGTISPQEAESIFAINHALGERSAAWTDFFVEALGEFLLNRQEPRGYMAEDQADWLIAQVTRDGRIDSMAELELLVRMIERASNVPETLKSFVLEQIEREVLTGTGPTRDGGELSDTHVSEAEVALLRRVLFGQASDRPAAISQREAELLFRIKDATLGALNARGWKRLFVQGVGNYLQGWSSPNAQITRDRAAELDRFMTDTDSGVGRFMARMVKAVPNSAGIVFGRKQADTPDLDARIAAEADITASEQSWLDAQVEANGEIDEYDRALLHFLAGGDPPAA
ncbi:MAG: hypothetical protein CL820_10555 [Croceicoccus sp.]|nr:hypothetical protein [Croceicoccus sp.]MAL26316.1 hypothetical protein [Croceicoccus sp.]|tara:strand:- start:128159 stop:129106 length:948 start_codon:yes stop_codon:yes gene_type:complete